jgi:hypothetical protein
VASCEKIKSLLDEAITPAATIVILLQLYELKFTKRLEYCLQVLLSDIEVDVAYIEPVERNRVRVSSRCFLVANLAILLRFGKLDDDGNS